MDVGTSVAAHERDIERDEQKAFFCYDAQVLN